MTMRPARPPEFANSVSTTESGVPPPPTITRAPGPRGPARLRHEVRASAARKASFIGARFYTIRAGSCRTRTGMETPASPQEQSNSIRGDAFVFLGIAALAFALRFVHLLQARSVPIFDALLMDGQSYSAWADRIVAGDWLGDRIFYQAPLYPYFLAVVKLAVGNDLWRIRLVQIAIGSLACGILFLAGRSFFTRRIGVLAGILL